MALHFQTLNSRVESFPALVLHLEISNSSLFRKLVRVRDVHLALSVPESALLLCGSVLDPDLLHFGLLEPADKVWVPQLGANAQILAAAHEGVGFAAFDSGGELVGAKVGVLALCL